MRKQNADNTSSNCPADLAKLVGEHQNPRVQVGKFILLASALELSPREDRFALAVKVVDTCTCCSVESGQ